MNKLKRILFILHKPPPIHGPSVIGNYIYESMAINQSFSCKFVNQNTSKTTNQVGKFRLYKIWFNLKNLSRVLFYLIWFNPNLCYLSLNATGPGFYKDIMIVLIINLFRKKKVYHFHNKGVSSFQDKWPNHLLYRFVLKNSEVILLSKELFPDIQKYVPEENVHYCPNGIAENEAIGETKDISKQKVELLFFSNLIKSKGVFILLEACVLLKGKQLPFHCIYAGEEGDISANQLREKIREMRLDKEVSYVGRKLGKEKEKKFQEADVFILPTYFDCFPLVILEAMRHSLPVISTFEGGIPEIVDEGLTGFLVSQKNPFELAERLELLIKNPTLREKIGKAGRAKYEKEYTLEAFERRIIKILQQII